MSRVHALLAAAALGLAGPGCIHVHLDGEKKDKLPAEVVPAGATQAKAETGVKPAGATVPSPSPTLSKAVAKLTPGKPQAVAIMAGFQNRVAYLPDPTKNGAMGAGLVGQLFLFDPAWKLVTPTGPLTIEMFDETARGGAAPKLGKWTFDKDTLARLRSSDERLGQAYTLFLPWPDYRADVTRVKLTFKYEPADGHPLWAEPVSITFDTTAPGSNVTPPVFDTVVAGTGMGQPQSPIGGPPPATYGAPGFAPTGTLPPPTVVQQPSAPGGAALPLGPGATPPGGLQPFVITAPQRR